MQTILDLDLDFFVWPIEYWPEGGGRLPEGECTHSRPDEVREFLETSCSLKRGKTIPGHEMVEHEDAFSTWRRWLHAGILTAPFDVIHVDAHADLGLGDGGWVYLLSELLALPLTERSEPRVGPRALNSGNYLAFAIANRWIASLTYVFPHRKPPAQGHEARPTDLMPLLFRDRNARTGLIELGRYSPDTVLRIAERTSNPPAPISVEPVVPFNYVPSYQFRFEGFTHMVVAQSPQYTPASADELLPIFRDYFVES
jgi:hypothetical protein